MSFLTGVVGITDETGERVDRPDANGDYAPVMLQLDSSMTAQSKTEAGITTVTMGRAASSGEGVVSVGALEMMAGVAGAALMKTNTRFFFGSAAPLSTVPWGPGSQWLRLGYSETASPAETPVEIPVVVAGTVVNVEVLFLAPGIGGGIYDFRVMKNPLGAMGEYGGPFVPADSTGVLSDGSHYSFDASDTIGALVFARDDIAGPIEGAPSKVWCAFTYVPA